MSLLSTVVSRPVFNLECFQSDLFTIQNDPNPKHGVKSYPGLTPLNFIAGPTRTMLQYYKFVHWTASSNIHICTVDLRKICLIFIWFFPVRYCVLHHKDPIRDSQRQGVLIIDAFPAHALTGLNCYNVTSGSAICNNVTSSSAMQVCKHGFTNLVSNVMKSGTFNNIIINVFMLKSTVT